MKKLGLLLSATGAMVIAGCGVAASHLTSSPERDASIIVEVDRNIDGLSKEGVKNTQDAVYNNIKSIVTSNVKRVKSYSVLNNAFLMEVNSQDIEAIKTVPGVKSVTVNKMHWTQVYNDDEYVTLGTDQDPDPDYDESKNISAETMKKPEDTNDGEGTLIAILDNEFHLRGKTKTADEWHHEVYDDLPDGTAVKYTFGAIKSISLNAGSRKFGTVAGEEGSMYLNSKVPFYFDYGGTSKVYGKTGDKKYDVHSDLSYHGSHVSSITAANAPTYKGIAPKAQLALMKVFTDYDAKGVGELIGLSNSTGAYDSVLLEALEDCITLKVDGINMSLGSDLDDFDSDSITLKTLTRLGKAGILSSISAGNSGKSSFASTGAYANWSTNSVETGIMSSYANNAASMTVASGHPTQVFYENAFVINNENIAFEDQIVNRQGLDDDYDREYRMKDIFEGHETLDWVYVPGFGTSADYSGLDLNGKIAVVNRGSTSFADKYSVAEDKGAIGLIIINNDPTASDFNFRCSFGDTQPRMPIALVLYKNKETFAEQKSGSFSIINKKVSDNPFKYTTSSFSTDGATFDLDLKPDITAPGDNIKGAVPEHAMTSLTKEEKEAIKYKAYQYLSGTSMSAPNYAGAQSVVLSKEAKGHYQTIAAINANTELTNAERNAQINAENAKYEKYRKTVDMRLMSTADPMKDAVENPESNVKSFTSPRIQGAGMVDLTGALSTDVYLEGLDLAGNPIGKSKIALRNNPDIAKGDIKLSFLAHNESSETRSYNVTLTVMRPAIAHPNDIVTKDYNYKGEIDSIESFTGMKYYDTDIGQMATATGKASYKDVYKVTKDILYPATEEAGQQYIQYIETNPTKARELFSTIKAGYYYNSASEGVSWEPLPSYTAQSTKDVLIDEITGQTVTLNPGDNTVTINPYSLSEQAKKTILDNYEYGCMIEGYVTLTSTDNHVDLSIPYLGFYSGTDVDANASYETAPITEPFNFEKDITKVYPSDLVNDITKSLIGKDKVNFESMIVAGYAKHPNSINTDKVLKNDMSFDGLTGFYKVGTDPLTNEYVENPGDNIYVGSPESTNTLIIQQFMLRSVVDNNFTITNKATGKVVYKSALEDMLFGDTMGKWSLYKSHVDAGYLSAGYVAHRAYAIVPLFNQTNNEPFASGEYELQFNYQLAATNSWVSKSYTIHIDSDDPVVTSINQYKDESGVERVRVYIKDDKLAYGIVGYNRVEVGFDSEKGLYYIDETKEFVEKAINEISEGGNKRLYVSATDFARGSIGCIAHFNDNENYSKGATIVSGNQVGVDVDFEYKDGVLKFYDSEGEEVFVGGKIYINNLEVESQKKGCKGSLATASLIICVPSLMGATMLFLRKKKQKGGKQYMKSKFTVGMMAVGIFAIGSIAACGGNKNNTVVTDFSFVASLATGGKSLNKGEEVQIVIDEVGGDGSAREYSYNSSNPDVASVSAKGKVTGKAKGEVRISIEEKNSKLSQILTLTVTDATPASGGFNYASLAGSEAIKTRTDILGQLEQYAMDNHLTGITLFENGGYVKYSERVKLGSENYITGYGFGLLAEGELLRPISTEENENHRMYLHTALSQDPKTINSRNDTGSQVSDLESYITSSYWGTRLNAERDQYEWYPLLAKDSVTYNGVSYTFNEPLPVFEDQVVAPEQADPNPLGLYNTWRIYVKTGADGGLKYRYAGGDWGVSFENRDVTIEDYEFAYRLLLTGSHKLKRGSSAASDQTYGIVGALKYFNNTESATDEGALALWEDMKDKGQLGIKTGNDANGDYLQLTIMTPIDRFTAMYTLSSSLYSPIPEAFIKAIGNGSVKEGAAKYGTFNDNADAGSHRNKILDYTICLGPYMLEGWEKSQIILFKKNASWFETNRYKIAGVKMIYIDTSTSTTAVYDRFYDEKAGKGIYDSCGIPTKYIKTEANNPLVRKTRGDATFKLNVNSCTQEMWDTLFGDNGKINKGSTWNVKPWMSNDNFLNGLFYSIDRKTFAENRGVQPSIDYFSDAYLSDPQNGISYNSTDAHKRAVEAYQTYDSNNNPTYGYSKDKAILSFRTAVKELVAKKKIVYGTAEKPYVINIHIRWMYQTDEKEYGEEIAGYFESAFNDPKVCENRVKLVVEQDAVTNWQDVYNEYLMKGQFDLGFGAISGNTYNPLNFLEVLKSDNSSTFTLNWGTDTSVISKKKPLIYQDKMWSFDALWAVADHGGVVDNGSVVKSVKKAFASIGKNDLSAGLNFMVPVTFISVPDVALEVSHLQLYVYGSQAYDLPFTISAGEGAGEKVIRVTLSAELAAEINKEIQRVNKMDDPSKDTYNATPFTYANYGKLWQLEVGYTLSINGGTPSETYVTVAKNEAAWIDDQEE